MKRLSCIVLYFLVYIAEGLSSLGFLGCPFALRCADRLSLVAVTLLFPLILKLWEINFLPLYAWVCAFYNLLTLVPMGYLFLLVSQAQAMMG